MNHARLEDAKRIVEWMYPERAMRVGDVGGVDVSIAQGLQFKRIAERPTPAQLASALDIVWKPGAPVKPRLSGSNARGPASRWAPRMAGAGALVGIVAASAAGRG